MSLTLDPEAVVDQFSDFGFSIDVENSTLMERRESSADGFNVLKWNCVIIMPVIMTADLFLDLKSCEK